MLNTLTAKFHFPLYILVISIILFQSDVPLNVRTFYILDKLYTNIIDLNPQS